MKLCFPVQAGSDVTSEVYNHFGTAPLFLIYNTEKKEISFLENQDANHIHAQTNPMRTLGGFLADAVIVGGIGPAALKGLNNMGIRVYKAIDKDVQTHIDLYLKGKLTEMTLAHASTSYDRPGNME